MGAGDGTGFKAGGYGMRSKVKMPNEIPHHVVKNCLAYKNKNKGFYANHHWEEFPGSIIPVIRIRLISVC